MSKILLTDEPSWLYNKCPFMDQKNGCKLNDRRLECHCIGGYYDANNFDFSKCPYCTVVNNKRNY